MEQHTIILFDESIAPYEIHLSATNVDIKKNVKRKKTDGTIEDAIRHIASSVSVEAAIIKIVTILSVEKKGKKQKVKIKDYLQEIKKSFIEVSTCFDLDLKSDFEKMKEEIKSIKTKLETEEI